MTKKNHIVLDQPEHTIQRYPGSGSGVLTFQTETVEVEVNFNGPWFDLLMLKLMEKRIALQKEEQEEQASHIALRKTAATMLSKVNDSDMQIWLAGLRNVSLGVMLWYLKDREITKRIFRNMPKSSAEVLLSDMAKFSGRDPDLDRGGLSDGPNELKAALAYLNELAESERIGSLI